MLDLVSSTNAPEVIHIQPAQDKFPSLTGNWHADPGFCFAQPFAYCKKADFHSSEASITLFHIWRENTHVNDSKAPVTHLASVSRPNIK